MSGDWMKVELELPDKPEVFRIASLLKLDPDLVVGKLLRVWAWFDKHTETGNADSVTYALVDRLTGVTGFGEAMAFAGWLVQHDHSLSLPKFDRHNGKTAKNRALTAKRVATSKAKSNAEGNAPIVTAALPREEKRREEKEEKLEKQTAGAVGLAAVVDLYHDYLPACQRIAVLTDKRKRAFASTEKIARQICAAHGWEYGPDFWRDFFSECAKDPWTRGDKANPNNPSWKQNLGTLTSEEHFAKIMDRALENLS